MVTPQEMRMFAQDCSQWAERASNASDREIILRIARNWMSTAASIERHLDAGWELTSPDLRTKLD